MGHAKAVTRSSQLSSARRGEAISVMRDSELDLLVIGGGIVGSGVALDAVTRGLVTGLVEARDFGSGTSSRSSKLVHGGIRYLEQLNFRLVREALIERGLLLRTLAPHLVKPIRLLYPLTSGLERLYVGIGMLLYDVFARTSIRAPGVPHHRHLSGRQLELAMPSLKRGAFSGGISYWDAQVDDARYVVTLARTAASFGAHVASQTEVVGLLRDGRRVVGVRALDKLTGEMFEIRAKQVVNATGVWTNETQAMVGHAVDFTVRASKGIHLVVPRDRIRAVMGMLLRTETSVLFILPWGRHWLIGTTDTDWHFNKAHPAATSADVDYLLDHVNRVLDTRLTQNDIEGVFAGLRPLLAGESELTSRLSREHVVVHPVPGLTLVAGGKWTTYRVMAKDAVDAASRGLGAGVGTSVTQRVPLIGAEGIDAYWNSRDRLAREFGLSVRQIEHLLNRYGSEIDALLSLIADNPKLGSPLEGAEEYLAVEVVFAAEHEGAVHLDDVLVRRTRIAIETRDRGLVAAPGVAALMGASLGWSAVRRRKEIESFQKRVDAERASQRELSDEEANRVRIEPLLEGARS